MFQDCGNSPLGPRLKVPCHAHTRNGASFILPPNFP